MILKDFSKEYPECFERGMRAAVNYVVCASEIPQKSLAADLDLAPSVFSRMVTLDPSDDEYQRRTLPLGILITLMVRTENFSPLATMLGYLGYDGDRLKEIYKSPAIALRLLADDVQIIKEQLDQTMKQISMLNVGDGPKKGRKQ